MITSMMVVESIVKTHYAPGYRAHYSECETCKEFYVEHEVFVDSDGPGEFCTQCGVVTQEKR